jgi:drug/metabolite transporter (DMT)-like permease
MARRALRRAELVAMALSYGGIVLVFVHDAGNLGAGIATGALLVFGSAIAYAIYLLGAGRVIARVGAMRFTAWAMLVASLATLLQFGVIHGFGDLPRAPRVYGLALAMAAFSTVLPIFVLSAAIRRIGSSRTSLVGSIGPIATIYFAWKFLGEPITLLQVTGSALVLAGVVAVGLGRSWEPPDPTESPTSTGSAKPSRW